MMIFFPIWSSLTFLWTAICFHPRGTKSVHHQIRLKVLHTFSPLSGKAITGICGIGFSLNCITFSFSHGMMTPWCVGGKSENISFLQVWGWGLLWLWYDTTRCLQQFAFIGAPGMASHKSLDSTQCGTEQLGQFIMFFPSCKLRRD